MQLPIHETVMNGISIVGTVVGNRADLAEVYELHRRGRTRVIAESSFHRYDGIAGTVASLDAVGPWLYEPDRAVTQAGLTVSGESQPSE